MKKTFTFLLLLFLSVNALTAFSQHAASKPPAAGGTNAPTQTTGSATPAAAGASGAAPASPSSATTNLYPTITFDPNTGPVIVPFDQPFYLLISNFPATTQITHVKIFRKNELHGRSFFADSICNPSGNWQYQPQFEPAKKFVPGGLRLTFPGIKPNSSFNIAIFEKLSDANLKLYFAFNKVMRSGKPDKITAAYKVLLDTFSYKPPTWDTVYFTYPTYALYSAFYEAKIKPIYAKAIDSSQFVPYEQPDNYCILICSRLLDSTKTNDNGLDFLNEISGNLIGLGLNSLIDKPLDNAVDQYDLDKRIANLTKSAALIDSVRAAIRHLKKRSLNMDIRLLDGQLSDDRIALQKNLTTLTKSAEAIKNMYVNSNDIINMTWFDANNEAKDATTLSGSILSTEFGMTNIFVKNNNNKTTYLPRLFMGVDIFFRQTNRDVKSRDLFRNQEEAKERWADSAKTSIISTKSCWQHLSLSLGLTLGSLPDSHFSNLYNTFSLVAGPSYRFCRYLRLGAGVAVLKRENPNPVLINQPIALGYYASFSVDLNFIQTATNFFSMITK